MSPLFYYRYKDGTGNDQIYHWLWQTLEDFSAEEKALFLRFVSGRSRLPSKVSEISQRFQISKGGRVRNISMFEIIVLYMFEITVQLCVRGLTPLLYVRGLTPLLCVRGS